MTIWDILLGICFVLPIGMAIRSAHAAHAGVIGYLLALVIAFIIGLSFAISMYSLREVVMERYKTAQRVVLNLILAAALIAQIIWIIVATISGLATTSSILRLVH